MLKLLISAETDWIYTSYDCGELLIKWKRVMKTRVG